MAKCSNTQGHVTPGYDPIQPEIELGRDFMLVLVICKNEADPMKAEAATMMTTFCPY